MIFGINITRDILKLSQITYNKLRITILKYHSWYLYKISPQIMLLPIQTYPRHDRNTEISATFSKGVSTPSFRMRKKTCETKVFWKM